MVLQLCALQMGKKLVQFLIETDYAHQYLITDDGTVLLSSEMGVLPINPSKVIKRWRLQPGKIFLIDQIEKKIINNEEIKKNMLLNIITILI